MQLDEKQEAEKQSRNSADASRRQEKADEARHKTGGKETRRVPSRPGTDPRMGKKRLPSQGCTCPCRSLLQQIYAVTGKPASRSFLNNREYYGYCLVNSHLPQNGQFRPRAQGRHGARARGGLAGSDVGTATLWQYTMHLTSLQYSSTACAQNRGRTNPGLPTYTEQLIPRAVMISLSSS